MGMGMGKGKGMIPGPARACVPRVLIGLILYVLYDNVRDNDECNVS